VNEALRDWISSPEDTFYVLGSAVGPHPYPDLVATLQSVISAEVKDQLASNHHLSHPDYVVACVGGGSNAIGAFYHYIEEPRTRLIGVEAGGCGIASGMSAATLALGRPGVLHGSRTMVLQTEDGQIEEAHSISAGLDYPGVGPQHAHLHATGRVRYETATDEEALEAAFELINFEGIVPALESAHALAHLKKLKAEPTDNVVVILSGSGAKDLDLFLRRKEKRDAI
jgi:tryptophan synthase beta chain